MIKPCIHHYDCTGCEQGVERSDTPGALIQEGTTDPRRVRRILASLQDAPILLTS